jgi:hypothetical protein
VKDAEVVFMLGFVSLGLLYAVVAIWEPVFGIVAAFAICVAAVTID